MSDRTTRQEWIETGYVHFATEGLDRVNVERLAKSLRLSKSGFYHYFGDQESYLETLMEHHITMGRRLAADLLNVRTIDPEFINLLIRYRLPVLAHNQLVRYRHHDLLYQTYKKVNLLVDHIIADLFASFIGFQDHLEFSTKYYSQVRDMFYTQVTPERLNYAFLSEFLNDAKETIRHAVAIASKT